MEQDGQGTVMVRQRVGLQLPCRRLGIVHGGRNGSCEFVRFATGDRQSPPTMLRTRSDDPLDPEDCFVAILPEPSLQRLLDRAGVLL